MNKLPTAEAWINQQFAKQIINEDIYASKEGIIEACILFAELHCTAQLEAILDNVDVTFDTYNGFENKVDKKSIINAYNLENIK